MPPAVVVLAKEESSMPLPRIEQMVGGGGGGGGGGGAGGGRGGAGREWGGVQAHAHEIYTRYHGKFIVVAGEELFVGDTPEEANSLAKAAHPEDKGRLGRYIYPKKMARVYGNQRRMAIL